jgi:GDP-L-fucose synthase
MSAPGDYALAGKRVWVAGHRGMVGSAVVRRLEREGCEVLTAPRAELDLRAQAAVDRWLADHRPHVIFLCAAKVGGILANSTQPAEFLHDNLAIQTNVIHGAYVHRVEKLLFLGSSCIYPRLAPQPLVEDALLTGALEPTNEAYAIAKIAGLKLCEAYRRQYGCDFISAMPTNLYGPGDNYDLRSGHVAAALQVREFLYVDDLADGLVFMMKRYSGPGFLNLGTGQEISIRGLAERLAAIAGWAGEFVYDRTKPDGTPRKVMDVSKLRALGWTAPTPLEDGLRRAYAWYAASVAARAP